MPTPHPARHRAHAFCPAQSWRPRRARALGALHTLSCPIPAPTSRSLAGPDHSRYLLAIVRPSAGRSAWLMALGHRALRPQACPMVRPPICHASTPSAGPHCPLSRTSARPLPLAPLTSAPPTVAGQLSSAPRAENLIQSAILFSYSCWERWSAVRGCWQTVDRTAL